MATATYGLFDTEYTTWKGAQECGWSGPGQFKEVFMLAAAIVTPGEPWESFPTFQVLMKPVINPVLSDYAVELVGVRQDRLEREGVSTREGLEMFRQFSGQVPFFSNGNDFGVIAGTCDLQRIANPLDGARFGSIHTPLYTALHERFAFEDRDYTSGRVHELVGIPPLPGLGHVHDPLRDVWSLHVTIEWLAARGVRVVPER